MSNFERELVKKLDRAFQRRNDQRLDVSECRVVILGDYRSAALTMSSVAAFKALLLRIAAPEPAGS